MTASTLPFDLTGKKIILGVSGGIAAYKAALLVRLLKRAGAEVQVLMTENATRFITPLTLGTLSERPVLIDIFPENEEGSWTRHVHLGRWADLFVVAPATAQTIAKLANGFCDSMLTAVALSAACPMMLCPAMDHDMYVHPATRENLERLRANGCEIVMPEHGELASGLVGLGRLPEPEDLLRRIADRLGSSPGPGASLRGVRVLVSAGPTREPMDPVRFISNPSTGTMGFALAAAAASRGAAVVLVAGPTPLPTPPGVRRVDVETAAEMKREVQRERDADLIIMAAAVADYRPAARSESKLKKRDERLLLELEPTDDILKELGAHRSDRQVLVGFAMETDDVLSNARAKLERKNLDWIVVNDLREPGAGFGTETNRVTLLHRSGREEALALASKWEVADRLLDRIIADPSFAERVKK